MNVGDYILDPFGGMALGGLDALSMGFNWRGFELEEKQEEGLGKWTKVET